MNPEPQISENEFEPRMSKKGPPTSKSRTSESPERAKNHILDVWGSTPNVQTPNVQTPNVQAPNVQNPPTSKFGRSGLSPEWLNPERLTRTSDPNVRPERPTERPTRMSDPNVRPERLNPERTNPECPSVRQSPTRLS